jgi:hypothetical protein
LFALQIGAQVMFTVPFGSNGASLWIILLIHKAIELSAAFRRVPFSDSRISDPAVVSNIYKHSQTMVQRG